MKTNDSTPVIFRLFGGEVIALFPAEASTVGNPYLCLSYEHVGQHCAADPYGIMRASRRATFVEYAPLAKELRARGYKLKIRHRVSPADLESRKKQLAR